MKALIVTAPGAYELRDIPAPLPGPFDCLVKIDACAICTGTDSDLISGSFAWPAPYPFVLGHESTGLIVEVGREVKNFHLGQRVTRPAAVFGGQSRNGLHSAWGGYAEYGLVRDGAAAMAAGAADASVSAASRSPLPDDVGPVEGALSINQREILSVVQRIPLDAGSRVAVIGSGYNGLLFALFCKHFGAGRVVMLGNPRLTDLATGRFGAHVLIDYRAGGPAGRIAEALDGPPTHLIDAVGSMHSLELSGQVAAPGTAFGCYGVRDFAASQPTRAGFAQSHPVLSMDTDEAGCTQEWVQLWRAGFFAQPGMVDDVMPFDQVRPAFKRLARREAVKIVLEM